MRTWYKRRKIWYKTATGGHDAHSRQSESAQKPGRYGDGAGLYLNIASGGSKSWVFRAVVDGKRRALGLGSFPAVTLARARELAAEHREAVATGRDPLAEKRAKRAEAATVPTFREAAEACHERRAPNRKVRYSRQWFASLELHAMPHLGAMRVDRIAKRDVLEVLEPIWSTKYETARDVRARMGAVLKWAMARDYRIDNPAGDAIDEALPPRPRHLQKHYRALPHEAVADALATVDASTSGMAARLCFRFLVLTATRSGEARGARWAEIDLERRLWTIPAARMKTHAAHRVPLSEAALDVLEAARPLALNGLVFPGPYKGGELSDMTLTKVLRTNGLAKRSTVHGFRTSFRTWAEECTGASFEAKEQALAHAVGNAVERAYSRSDLLEQRRALMDAWAAFLGAPVMLKAVA